MGKRGTKGALKVFQRIKLIIQKFCQNPRRSLRLFFAIVSDDGASIASTISDKAGRSAAFELMRKNKVTRVSFERNGLCWVSDIGDTIGKSLWNSGQYQMRDIEWLLGLPIWSEDRNWVVDVGANIGTTTVPLVARGFQCLAIEPMPDTFEMLRINLERNYLKAICHRGAITRTSGTAEMWVGFGSGQSEIVVDGVDPAMERWGSRGKKVVVDSCMLNEVVAQYSIPYEKVRFVWSDVQGSETDVVATGSSLWTNGAALLAEVDPLSLEIHGGVQEFVRICEEYFAYFLPAQSDIHEIQGISKLSVWIRDFESVTHRDVLFFSREARIPELGI